MAELDIGEHCSFSSCQQLDFLPLKCSGCFQIFCKLHAVPDTHECSRVNITTDHGEYSGPRGYACRVEGCTNRELTAVVCEACHLNFCLGHRHQVDHACTKYEAPPERMANTKAHINNIIESKASNPSRKGQGRKSKVTAATVALMKLKQTALGPNSIPGNERVYLNVLLPLGSGAKSKPMFFSKVWSIGRIIDAMAANAGIQNNNNVGGAKKLRIFDLDDGHLFETDTTLESNLATENGILNGGSVILEYVEESAAVLLELEKYKQ